MLSAPLGDHRVVAQLGPQRGQTLRVLNPLAAWIWRSHRAGLRREEMAELLAARFQLPLAQARADIAGLLDAWQCTLGAETAFPAWTLRLADRRIALTVDDLDLAALLERITHHLWDKTAATPAACLHLTGTAAAWRLEVNSAVVAAGDTLDEAVARTLFELVAAGCATVQRLLVLHAAGVSRAGQGLLLIGPGGAGKTTLAAALNVSGWNLLSDDVIPVTLDGHLLGLGLSLCLKAGSWPALALAPWLPNLDRAPLIERAGQPVRFPTPPGPIHRGPLPTAAFLFPRYQPDREPALEPLDPVRVLQCLIEAESVIPDLTQDKLLALTRWIGSAPGFALTYPTLDHALDLIAGIQS